MGTHDSTTLPKRQLGRYLREARQAANMTLEEVAPLMQWSTSKLQRVEKGEAPIVRIVDVEALCRIYDLDEDLTTALVGLAKQATVKSWWHSYDDIIPRSFNLYVGLESSAHQLVIFRPDIVPGLFQTPGYARILDEIYFPDRSSEEIDRRVELRMRRQALITRKTRPASIDLTLQEAALRIMVGNSAIMADQINHLMNQPPNVNVRILPNSVGIPTGKATGPFVILDFGRDNKPSKTDPTVVFVESYTGDMYHERKADVDRYRHAYAVIQHAALDVPASNRLLRQVKKEYEE